MTPDPRRSLVATDITGGLGVAIVGERVLAELGWLFRTQHEHDYGIDAQVESVEDDQPTGRLLALQIKSGPSHFKEPKDDGWIFRPKKRHVRYWLGHSLPVVIVLVDVALRKVYWAPVTAESLTATRKGYKIYVPRANELEVAAEPWARMLDESFQDAEERFGDNLRLLPPTAAKALEILKAADAVSATLLAEALVAASVDPGPGIDRLLSSSNRVWLERGGFHAWRALANYCHEHECHAQAAASLVEAASLNADRASELHALAAIQLQGLGDTEAQVQLELARRCTPTAELEIAIAAATIQPSLIDPTDPSFDASVRATIINNGDREIVARFLGARASRLGDLTEAALQWEKVLIAAPDAAAVAGALAEVYLQRSQTSAATIVDLSRAEQLARQSSEQHRQWKPSSVHPALTLVRTLGLQSRYDETLRLCLPHPDGSATDAQISNPRFARAAAVTAELAGRADLVPTIVSRVGDPDQRSLLELRFAPISADHASQVASKREVLDRTAAGDWDEIVGLVIELASLGEDESARLQPGVAAGVVPADVQGLVSTIAHSRDSPLSALPALRAYAPSGPIAATALMDALERAGDLEGALVVARRAEAAFAGTGFVQYEVRLLIKAGKDDDAEHRMRAALEDGSARGHARLAFRTGLGERSADRGDWDEAARQFRAILEEAAHSDTPNRVIWNLVICELRAGRPAEARSIIDSHAPDITTDQEARVWLQTISETGWSTAQAQRALALATQTENIELATAMVGAVIHFTRGVGAEPDEDGSPSDIRPQVPGQIHAQAFQLLGELIEENGEDAVAIKRVMAEDGDVIERLAELAGPSEAAADVRRAVAEATVPLGLLALLTRSSYALTNVRHGAGVRVVSTPDPELHQHETDVAEAAFRTTVVADLSAICLANELDAFQSASAAFLDVQITSTAISDARQGTIQARTDTATVGYFSVIGGVPRFVEADPAVQLDAVRAADALESSARTLTRVPAPTDFPMLGAIVDRLSSEPWIDCIEYAASHGLTLWSDDLAQRNLARAVGVAAFGTVNVLEALRTLALSHDASADQVEAFLSEQEALVESLVRLGAVDQPVNAALITRMVIQAGGGPCGAELVLARPAWWVDQGSIEAWFGIRDAIKEVAPDQVPLWLAAAMRGVARIPGLDGSRLSELLAILAMVGINSEPTVSIARQGLEMAEFVAAELGIPSPRELVAETVALISEQAGIADPAAFVADVLRTNDGVEFEN